MIERHTFKKFIETIVFMENGIQELEKALQCQFNQNWMTNAPDKIIRAIAEGFFEKVDTNSLEEDLADTIESLLYHFIYMEDCGNDSEHCKSKLVVVDKGKKTEHSIPCTNVDELYNVILIYIDNSTSEFTFNYCHSYALDNDVLKN